jgi:hypothetical protein
MDQVLQMASYLVDASPIRFVGEIRSRFIVDGSPPAWVILVAGDEVPVEVRDDVP